MPQRPDGAAARPQRVTFTKGSAERIAAVVRDYEAGDRGAEPLRFGTVATSDAKKAFRIATFSGAWSINSAKTVTFKYQTSTPNTANVTNLFFPIVGTATSSVDCAIARDGTAWFLIDVPLETATASVTVLTGVELTTAGLQFTRASVTVLASSTLTITTIGTTAC